MDQQQSEERYQRILERASTLERQAKMIRRVVRSLTAELPKEYQLQDEAYHCLVLNNQRMGIDSRLTYKAATGDYFGYREQTVALRHFDQNGDPLARKLLEFRDSQPLAAWVELDRNPSRIVERMITRTLTGDEYVQLLERLAQ